MKINAPKIQITGKTASGKSTLAFAIKNMLDEHGIKCEITGHEDEVQGIMEGTWRDRLKHLNGNVVGIETVQV